MSIPFRWTFFCCTSVLSLLPATGVSQVSESKIESAIARDAGAPGDNYEVYARKLTETLENFSPGQLRGILAEVPLSAILGHEQPPSAEGTSPPSPEMTAFNQAQQALATAQTALQEAQTAYKAAVADKARQRDGIPGNYTSAVVKAAAALTQAKSDYQQAQQSYQAAVDSLTASGLKPTS